MKEKRKKRERDGGRRERQRRRERERERERKPKCITALLIEVITNTHKINKASKGWCSSVTQAFCESKLCVHHPSSMLFSAFHFPSLARVKCYHIGWVEGGITGKKKEKLFLRSITLTFFFFWNVKDQSVAWL